MESKFAKGKFFRAIIICKNLTIKDMADKNHLEIEINKHFLTLIFYSC